MESTIAVPGRAHPAADGATLEGLLTAIDVRIRRQRRVELAGGNVLALEPGVLSFVFVMSGRLHAGLTGERPESIERGGLLLSSGRRGGALVADGDVRLVLSELQLADDAAHIGVLLPDVLAIRDFAGLEPAAAALLPHLGVEGADACLGRSGDHVICRMMAGTVLASAIRAWASHCAPPGWPAGAIDPFLDRVVAAIRAEPGRDWTVEELASLSAMSRSVFAERFRSIFGRSPVGYVTAVRMGAAQDLLVRGHSVSTVARELGYSSDEGFSRAFRRHTGATPSAWRAANHRVPA
ncbi:helix-turn-helix domain-containing protein [Microbacterium timonense]|uniref:helix-turn-helix domain-containing protein n=1 Tax=Microbacterium timonense TaxID=2086576 RepID=UPI000D0ECD06|nr:AraC family transcriptional regulator [Microbacterium timonense]